jgi:archaellum biogenesis protein FlaJ (TadC family)
VGDSIIPKKLRKNILNYLERASIPEVPYFKYGIATYIIILISVILDVLFLSTSLFENASIAIMIVVFLLVLPIIFIVISIIVIICYRLYLDARIFHKVRKMEEMFPEFLAELALNLTAGQSLEDALDNSTEKEYGYLTKEIKKVSRRVKLGTEIEVALKEFTSNYNSEIIEETFDLIITSWKKGGKTSQLVERIYDNLDVMRYLRKKVIASVTSYRIFLSIVTIVIAPAMFALSYYLIDLIRSITSNISTTTTSVALPIAINAVRINEVHFSTFSALALILISICTAIIISIIKTGTIKEGYKQVAFYAAATLISYKIFMLLFEYFFALFNV